MSSIDSADVSALASIGRSRADTKRASRGVSEAIRQESALGRFNSLSQSAFAGTTKARADNSLQ
jgi:hypothetical protein